VFYGAEAEIKYALTDWLDAAVFGDYVRARTRDHENLPRIPPGRLGGTLEARLDGWQAFVQFYHVFAQHKDAPFESSTGGYNMLNAGVAYGGEALGPLTGWQVYLRANNLLNEKAFVHTSFIKDSAPLPGLNVTLGARLTF
jgi:iron complex outermembrane receptor protein